MSKVIGTILTVLLISAIAVGTFVYLGSYDVAADVPHSSFVAWFLQTARKRSVAVHARGVSVPADFGGQEQVSTGAGLYAEMCAGCHLGPGMEKTEISQGLNPRAPELFEGTNLTPAEEFWIVKHGVKMTGMAAWGPTHDDMLIWDLVAFVQRLPGLSAEQYQTLVKNAPEEHEEIMKKQPQTH